MTQTAEETEILTNARAAYEAGEITQEQWVDVRLIVIAAETERMVLECKE